MLSRLAVNTGGRFTENTNDFSLGYARAQRDLACRYTLGFYDGSGDEDRVHHVRVKMKEPGLHAFAPSSYIFRSPSVKRERLVTAAFLSPESFDTGYVRGHLFPLAPTKSKKWESLLALNFPVELGEVGEVTMKNFGVTLVKDQKPVHQFNRWVRVEPTHRSIYSTKQFTLHEGIKNLKPGEYEMRVVISDVKTHQVRATRTTISLPAIPKRELFLLSPVLLRQTGTDIFYPDARPKNKLARDNYSVEIADDGFATPESQQPILVQIVPARTPISTMVIACLLRKRGNLDEVLFRRELLTAKGDPIQPPLETVLSLQGEGQARCQSAQDILPADLPAQEYIFRATLLSQPSLEPLHQTETRFSITDRAMNRFQDNTLMGR